MARSFNGTSSDVITIPNGAAIPLSSAVTVAFWNKVTTAVASTAFTMGTGFNPDSCSANAPWSDGILYWNYGNTATTGRISANYSSYLGGWAHVGLVSAGSSGSLKAIYLNGVSAASDTGASGGPTVATAGGTVGAWTWVGSYHTGSIGHFAVWTVALTANEIAMLYTGTAPTRIRQSNLIVYYPLWGASSTEADLSGNVLNGTVTGTTIVADPPVGCYAPMPLVAGQSTSVAAPPAKRSLIVSRALRRSTLY